MLCVRLLFLAPDHDYCNPQGFNLFEDATLGYIAGWVVRNASDNIDCSTCQAALVQNLEQHVLPTTNCHLIHLKNRGGLVIPSPAAVEVVECCEKVLCRRFSMGIIYPTAYRDVWRPVVEYLGGRDIFVLGRHGIETQNAIDSHEHTLISLVVRAYLDLRLWGIAKCATEKAQLTQCRQKFNKIVLFMGQ